MAYVIPTPADVKTAYPEFAAVGDPAIQEALDKGGLVIDETWPEPAFPLAYKLYAAHVLRLGGEGTVASSTVDLGGLKRRKAGDHELEAFAPGVSSAAAGSAAWYSGTPYGVEFYTMQRRYFGGPRVF